MAAKKDSAVRITDIKAPGKSTPAASGRPIIVTNHPVLSNDPMVTGGDTSRADVAVDTMPVTHTAKVIKPLTDDTEVLTSKAETEKEPTAPAIRIEPVNKKIRLATTQTEPASTEDVPDTLNDTSGGSTKTIVQPPSSGESEEVAPHNEEQNVPQADQPDGADTNTDDDAAGDVDGENVATQGAADEARAAREAELEQLIASGKYALPIKTVKHGSRFFRNLLFVLLVLVVAAVAVDALLDAGIISIGNFNAPTDFFKDA